MCKLYIHFFSGGSLADLIDKNNNSNEVMAEGELKPLLIQVAEVIINAIKYSSLSLLNINAFKSSE